MWDFWFAWRDEELHAFYLQADQAACHYNPEARHNQAAVGHALLTRWGWRECGGAPVLTPAAGGGWENFAIWTGSIVKPDAAAPWPLFYTSRSREDSPLWTPSEWQRPQQIGVAVSRDLFNWEQTDASRRAPVIPNPGRHCDLDGVAWRDPYVIRGADGEFQAFICARLDPEKRLAPPDAGGVIAYVASPDLAHWADTPTLLDCPHEFYQMEVPQVFWRTTPEGQRCYLLFCAQERDCARTRRAQGLACATGTYYLRSQLLPHAYQGVPAFNESAQLLAPGLYGGKLLRPETDERPVFFGFPWADAAGHFIGGISDPLTVRFLADGRMELEEWLA